MLKIQFLLVHGANMEVAELPAFELSSSRPLQTQIHEQLAQWIGQGRLSPGVRLPSTRTLSDTLSVSRNTVSAVIDQLKAEGFIESHIGRGNFIAADIPELLVLPASRSGCDAQAYPGLSDFAISLATKQARHKKPSLPFTPGIPDLQNFPSALWHKLWRRHQDRQVLMGYDDDQGYLPLREALAKYLRISRGVNCSAQQILITQGAQQGLSLCAQLLVNSGDTVLHEDPGYRGAKEAFLIQRPKVLYVPLNHGVIDVDWIIKNNTSTSSAKLMYISPTHQYPMGGLLSASQRLALLQWAQTNRTWIIEDDYDSEFHFTHKPVAAMQGMTQTNNVIYMGSFSKTLLPALRLGYLVLPEALMNPFTVAKSNLTGETSVLPQAVVADFIEEGHFVRHLRKMRFLYKNKWLHLEQLIRQTFGDAVEVVAESAGMHLVIRIAGCDDVSLNKALEAKGFGGTPLSSYFHGNKKQTGLVLGFANTSEQQRIDYVEALKQLLRVFRY